MSAQDYIFRALAAAAVVLASVIFLDWLNRDTRVPIETWGRVEVLNSPIYAGDYLRTRIYRKKVRDDCPVTSIREAIDQDGHSIEMPNGISPGGASNLLYVPVDYPTPSDMPPGQYELHVSLEYACPGFTWATEQPIARFRVIERGASFGPPPCARGACPLSEPSPEEIEP